MLLDALMIVLMRRSTFIAGAVDDAGDKSTSPADSASGQTEAALKRLRISAGPAMSSVQLDEGVQLVLSMPPLLLVAADRLFEVSSTGTPPVLLASEAWPACRTADIVVLMARLWLLNTVIKQPTIKLSQLLGGIDAGSHEVVLRVPTAGFALGHIEWQMNLAAFNVQVGHVDTSWAYIALESADIDSWLFLRSGPNGKVVSVQLQGKQQKHPRTLSLAHEDQSASQMFWVRGLQHVLLVVTNQHKPERRTSWLRLLSLSGPRYDPAILVTPERHKVYYSGSKNLLLSALAERC